MSTKSEIIFNIAGKRGFFFPTAEIYGSVAGFWTYGHLGSIIKHKWENLWRQYFLKLDDNYYEIQGSSILPAKVLQSSGHVINFNDPVLECKKCENKLRADQYIEEKLGTNVEGLNSESLSKVIKDNKIKCPKCEGDFKDVTLFNMMFNLKVGVTGDNVAYLSPETAQNPYLSFKREFLALRERLPMGLAMIGKAYRNEISPRQGFFRMREFTQAELQIFFDPDKINECENWNKVKNYKLLILEKDKVKEISCDELNSKLKVPKFYAYYLAMVQKFYLDTLNIPKKLFRFRVLNEKERAFYNKIHYDIELDLDTIGGFKEVGGVHYRTDHDLKGHQNSGEKLDVFIDNKRFVPHVLELSFGVDRNLWSLFDLFFRHGKERDTFTFPNTLVPVQVAIFPLVNKQGLPKLARDIYDELKNEFEVFYDDKGSIGKMYRRMDEIGCPYMVTVDHESLKNKDVTIRNRDDMKQRRVKIKELNSILSNLLCGNIKFDKVGKAVK